MEFWSCLFVKTGIPLLNLSFGIKGKTFIILAPYLKKILITLPMEKLSDSFSHQFADEFFVIPKIS